MEQAEALERNQRDRAIAAASGKLRETHPDFDGTHCVESDCGEPIPQLRLTLGKVRCVACQALREKYHNRKESPYG